jgi:hypothetical protein
MPVIPHAAIADAGEETPDPSVLLDEVLRASAFDQKFKADGGACRAVILVDLGAFEIDSPALPSRPMIESLVDRLAALGWTDLSLASSSDASYTWSENRNVATLADLFGYQYQTSSGTPYDIADLSENLADADFAPGSILAGTPLSSSWLDAGLRIIVAKAAIDQRHTFVLAANTLLAALPRVDRDRSYRLPMHAASVLSALLDLTPPDYCIVDLCGFAHGSGGRQIPRLYTGSGAIVGGDDLLAVDMISAGKLGADPGSSDVWKALVAARGLKIPAVTGSIAPLHDVRLPDPLLVQSTRARDESEIFCNLFSPWLQMTDESLFPLKHAVDMSINAWARSRINDLDADVTTRSALISLNWLAAYLNYLMNAWCITNDKDRIRRRIEPVSPETVACTPADYQRMQEELDTLRQWLKARTGHEVKGKPEFLTRLNRAVVFEATRTYPVPFAEFACCVDISKSIQFMNDYIGGSVQVTVQDSLGRPLRQVERNIYLPQPNYLSWVGAKDIDVSKIEAIEYGERAHRIHWKTIKSENRSATYDDGIVVFESVEHGMTRVTLFGRQLFTLPPVIEGMHLENQPLLEDFLTRLAYEEFFSRTFANFEALLDGRDVKIGVPNPSMRSPFDAPPRSIERIQAVALRLAELAGAAFEQFRPMLKSSALNEAASSAGVTDEQGFRHFRAAPVPAPDEPAGAVTPWSRLFDGYSEALTRDVAALWKSNTHRMTVP